LKTFRPYRPGQVLLMAPDAREWVPAGDLAHFVEEILDLSAIYDSYVDERGFPPYDPRLMVKLLVYGYATGITSSRKPETATHRDVAVRMLCAGQQPDYRAVARFRKRHLEALTELFVQTLRRCRKAGLVRLHALAVDGTKLRANASRHKAMSYDRMLKAEADLDAETRELRAIAERVLAEAAAVDAAEDEQFGPDNRGDELPPELRRREDRLKWIREAKAALEAEAEAAETARREQMRAVLLDRREVGAAQREDQDRAGAVGAETCAGDPARHRAAAGTAGPAPSPSRCYSPSSSRSAPSAAAPKPLGRCRRPDSRVQRVR
jgi:transposase